MIQKKDTEHHNSSHKIYKTHEELMIALNRYLGFSFLYEMTPVIRKVDTTICENRKFAIVVRIFSYLLGVVDHSSISRVFFSLNNVYYFEAECKYSEYCGKNIWTFTDSPIKVVPFSEWSVYIETDIDIPFELIGVVSGKESFMGNIKGKVWKEDFTTLEEDPNREIIRRNDIILNYSVWKDYEGAIELR